MEYKARHVQPFTVEQAVLLETAVITSGGCKSRLLCHKLTYLTEIARLQNSLEHLQNTQRQLHENVNSEEHADPILLQALEENKVVMCGLLYAQRQIDPTYLTLQIVPRREDIHVASCPGT